MVPGDLLSALPNAAVLIDGDEFIAGANAAAREILGKNITGRHFSTILRQPQVIAAIESCISTGTPQQTRHIAPEKSQDAVYDLTVSAIRDRDAPPNRQTVDWVLISFDDVSDANQVGQMRRDFVANVSHELRTPLTAMLGFIETLRGAARHDEAARDRFLGIMETESRRMDRLIGELLTLSRVESQERIRPTDRISAPDVISATVKTLRPTIEKHNLSVNVTAADDLRPVIGDFDQLQQVFSNLIENAVKYGADGGKVDISISFIKRDPELRGPAIQVTVRDFGHGISSKHLPRLTERFYRVDDHRSREVGGTGLGLAIVKHIIHRHRGRLNVQSTLGQGSEFSVILPAA